MSEENDSWFKKAFGIDLAKAVAEVKDEVEAAASTVSQVVGKAQGAVAKGTAAGEAGSFPLGGSVGRGGKNAPGDVRAVQAALGITADGDCGPKTVAAIEAYQKKIGQAKPDGRVDAGGATERALTAGATAPAILEKPSPSSGLATGKRAHKPVSLEPDYGGPAPPDDVRTLGGRAIDGMRDMLSDTDLARHLTPAAPDDRGDGSVEGHLFDLQQQQAALLQSLQNTGSTAEREHSRQEISEELEGVNAEISSELWKLKAAEAIQESQSPEAQARAEAARELNPQLEQRYLTAEGNFTQAELDARRIQRGLKAARKGVAAAATLWATDDVGLAEVVGAATGALGSLVNPPPIPVTGPSTVPPSSAPTRSDPIGTDISGLSQSKARAP